MSINSPLHDAVCALNIEGTPLLKQNEIVYRIPPSVSLYRNEERVEKDGVLYVTSHRLIWADALRTRARQWSLSQIEGEPRTEAKGLFTVFSTPKILLVFAEPLLTKAVEDKTTTTSLYPALLSSAMAPTKANSSSTSSSTVKQAPVEVKISCGENTQKNVLDDIRTALQRKAWKEEEEVGYAAASSVASSSLSPTRAGVAGIVEAESREKIASRALAAEALQGDLASLERHAKKMVALAENYAIEVEKARIRKAAASAAVSTTESSSSSSSASVEADEAWTQQMQNVGTLAAGMGIVSPVTKSIAGSAYTSELARQLSVVLRPHLQRRGGVVSLTDAFCLLNRARGTEVVSPEDLYEASLLLGELKLGMQLRVVLVTSGKEGQGGGGGGSFRAIQLDTFSDAAVTSRILAMIDERKGGGEKSNSIAYYQSFVTAHEITKLMGIPIPFVKQILLQAEKNGTLCRDESIAGLRFYKNLIVP